MHRLEHLRNLVQQGDAEGFARVMGLDPVRTRQWFADDFPQEGYGKEVIVAIGAHVLKALTSRIKSTTSMAEGGSTSQRRFTVHSADYIIQHSQEDSAAWANTED
jgi:hypothetical protein